MALREIRVIGDPVLRTPCDPIRDIDQSVKALVEDLLETVDMDGRAGLAANQIGVGLRAFSYNIDGEIGYVLNPRIVELSEDEYQDRAAFLYRSCGSPLSVHGMRVWRASIWMVSPLSLKVRSLWLVVFNTNVITWMACSTLIAWIVRLASALCARFASRTTKNNI